jgi:SAM-dependent methyltransferase
MSVHLQAPMHGIEVGPCKMRSLLPIGVTAATFDRHKGTSVGVDCPPPDIRGDASDMAPVKDATFDFLIANHVLEHMPNLGATLTHWMRVLRPGGLLLVALPNVCDMEWLCGEHSRLVTTPQHLLEEYHTNRLANHSEEIGVSAFSLYHPPMPRTRRLVGMSVTPAAIRKRVLRMKSPALYHHHTFTMDTLGDALRLFSDLLGFSVVSVEAVRGSRFNGGELRAVCRKR